MCRSEHTGQAWVPRVGRQPKGMSRPSEYEERVIHKATPRLRSVVPRVLYLQGYCVPDGRVNLKERKPGFKALGVLLAPPSIYLVHYRSGSLIVHLADRGSPPERPPETIVLNLDILQEELTVPCLGPSEVRPEGGVIVQYPGPTLALDEKVPLSGLFSIQLNHNREGTLLLDRSAIGRQ